MILNIKSYMRDLQSEIDALDEVVVGCVADVIWRCYVDRRRLVVCGNGGSASTASHFVTDLQKGMSLASQDSAPWEVISLCDSIPLITAWSNDTDYANVFAGQARTWLRRGDLLVSISGSGNSPNVLAAVQVAHDIGAETIGFCGFGGGKLARKVDHALVLESTNMQHVEDIHMIVAHAIFAALRDRVSLVTAPAILEGVRQKPVEVGR